MSSFSGSAGEVGEVGLSGAAVESDAAFLSGCGFRLKILPPASTDATSARAAIAHQIQVGRLRSRAAFTSSAEA